MYVARYPTGNRIAKGKWAATRKSTLNRNSGGPRALYHSNPPKAGNDSAFDSTRPGGTQERLRE